MKLNGTGNGSVAGAWSIRIWFYSLGSMMPYAAYGSVTPSVGQACVKYSFSLLLFMYSLSAYCFLNTNHTHFISPTGGLLCMLCTSEYPLLPLGGHAWMRGLMLMFCTYLQLKECIRLLNLIGMMYAISMLRKEH